VRHRAIRNQLPPVRAKVSGSTRRRSVGVPVTLVYGDADAVVTPDHGRWYADQLVNPDLRVVPDAGHLVVITEWAFILDAVTARG